jgi:FecR-like protein
MDESELINEVLELTLACQKGDATPEEHARLERLLADNPRAILWYLRIVDDTLTLLDAATARETASTTAPAIVSTMKSHETSPARRGGPVLSLAGRRARLKMAFAGVACASLVALVMFKLLSPPKATDEPVAVNDSARILEVSNVEWVEGATHYDEWSLLRPGATLKFKSGWINLFFSNGAELLIEGPADVRFDSSRKVFAKQGKLAARVGPGAVGFRIETPHANVIDRGTEFGLSVDKNKRTSVVVYKGVVDLDVVGDSAQPRHRLGTGEALRVDRAGQLSRITTVASNEFLEPPQLRFNAATQKGLIASISDNIRSLKTTKYYRVIPHGFCEDCQAYVDRLHEWNGVDGRGLPPFLVGGDYVMTFNDDKIAKDLSIALSLGQPANVYVLIDDRVPPADWLKKDFVDTGWDVGADEGYVGREIQTAKGTGQSIDRVYSVWRRKVTHADTVVLGALGVEQFTKPARDVERSMYGIVVTPLRGDRAN